MMTNGQRCLVWVFKLLGCSTSCIKSSRNKNFAAFLLYQKFANIFSFGSTGWNLFLKFQKLKNHEMKVLDLKKLKDFSHFYRRLQVSCQGDVEVTKSFASNFDLYLLPMGSFSKMAESPSIFWDLKLSWLFNFWGFQKHFISGGPKEKVCFKVLI
jgi:hypothetical protein